MKQWSIGSGPAGTLLVVGDPDNPIPVLIQNVDPVNIAYLGETAAVNPANPIESVPLTPGQSCIATGDINVFVIAAPGQNVAINTLRGFGSFFQPAKVFQAGDSIINEQGVFIYDGPPALGNLKFSIAARAGVDVPFGNHYTDNAAAYNLAVPGGGYAQMATNPATGIPYFILNPAGLTHLGSFPQINASGVNTGAVNEQTQLDIDSGNETGQGTGGSSVVQLISRQNNATGPGGAFAQLLSDNIRGVRADGNSYALGHQTLIALTPITINLTSAQTLNGCTAPVVAGFYKFIVDLQFTANASAGNPSFQIGTNAPVFIWWGNAIIWQTSGTGAGANRFVASTSGLGFQGPAMVAGAVYSVTIAGHAQFNGPGNVSLQAFTSIAADTFVINNADFEIIPQF
jgi:hypothetical protein